MNVRSLDRALEERPVDFERVHAMDTTHVLFGRMIDDAARVLAAKIVIADPC